MLHYIIVEVVSGSQSFAVNKVFTSHSFEILLKFWVWVATNNMGKVKRNRERGYSRILSKSIDVTAEGNQGLDMVESYKVGEGGVPELRASVGVRVRRCSRWE